MWCKEGGCFESEREKDLLDEKNFTPLIHNRHGK